MNLIKLMEKTATWICAVALVSSSVTGYAEIINGNEVYNWSASSVKVPTVVPFSMDFNDTSNGTLPLQVASASDTEYCSNMVCISNSIYAPDIYYDLKDQSNGTDGYVALEYIYDPAKLAEMKFKNEFYVVNIPASTSNFTVDFELYNDGNADDITFRMNRFGGYNEDWMNLYNYLQPNKWQRIALTFMDTSVTLYVDGEQKASVGRTIDPAVTTNAWVYLGTNFLRGEARTSLTAIDNMKLYSGGFKAVELEDYQAQDGSWSFKSDAGFEIKQEMTVAEMKQSLSEVSGFETMYDIQIVDEDGSVVADDALIANTHKIRIQPASYNETSVYYAIVCNIMLKNVRFNESEDGVSVSATYTNVTGDVQSVTAVLTVWDGNKMKDITVFPIENCQPYADSIEISTDCVVADENDTVEFVIVNSLSQPYILSSKVYIKQ